MQILLHFYVLSVCESSNSSTKRMFVEVIGLVRRLLEQGWVGTAVGLGFGWVLNLLMTPPCSFLTLQLGKFTGLRTALILGGDK